MNFFFVILFAIAMLNGFLAFIFLYRFNTPVGRAIGFILLSNTLYSLGYGFELNSTTLVDVLFWVKIEYFGIAFIPFLVVNFTYEYIGKSDLFNWRIKVILLSISLATLFFLYTNPIFGLFYKEIKLVQQGSLYILDTIKGPWYWVHQIVLTISYTVLVVAFVKMAISHQKILRLQAIVMLGSSMIVWVTYLIYLTGNSPFGIDIIPFSYSFVGIIWAWSMFRFKFGDFKPLALESVFESLDDGVIICDEKWRVINFNKAAISIFNHLDHDSIGKPLNEVFKTYPDIVTRLNENKSFELEVPVENDKKYYSIRINSINSKNNEQIGNTLLIHDFTKRKNYEIKLLQNEEKLRDLLATREKFISILGHDLRGPIGNIALLSDMLYADYSIQTDEYRQNAIKLIKEGSSNSAKLLENILLWSQSQKGTIKFDPEPVDLNLLVAQAVKLLQPIALEKSISIKNHCELGNILVVDKNMLASVIRNLISNAIKFSYAGGIVDIECAKEEGAVKLSVIDKGIGISPEMIKKIFVLGKVRSKNGTANETGSGLGLVLCKDFVSRHNGKIWAESDPVQGSRFYVSIPECIH